MPKGIPENGKNKGWFKKGEVSGCNNHHWKGGKYLNEGYRYILIPKHPFAKINGYVAEHRIVLENYLKRYITKKEMPHHINHIRNDNRLKNLMLFSDRVNHVKFENNVKINPSNIIFDGAKFRKEKMQCMTTI